MFTQASGSENTIEGRLLPLRACSAGVVGVALFLFCPETYEEQSEQIALRVALQFEALCTRAASTFAA